MSYSRMVPECQQGANKLLDEKGIEVELIDLRTINPLNYDSMYSSIKKTEKLLLFTKPIQLAVLVQKLWLEYRKTV